MSMSINYFFVAAYTDSTGTAKAPNPAPTIDVQDLSTPAGALAVTNGNPTAATLVGVYVYTYAASARGLYLGKFKTTDTSVQAKHLWSFSRPDYDANGNVLVSLHAILDTLLTESGAGRLAAGVKQWFDVTSPTGTVNSLPDAIAGAEGGVAIVGSEMNLADNAITTAKVDTGVTVGTLGATGQWTITVTVRDASTLVGIPLALVTVKGSNDTVQIDQRNTDNNGQCAGVYAFSLDDGTYKVHLALPGYQSAIETLVVSGANQSATYDLTAIAIGTPSAPNLCRVYGYEYLNGVAVEGRSVTARLVGLPQTTSTVILEGTGSSALSDANGYWYLDLVQGKEYEISNKEWGPAKRITIPAQSSLDMRTLLT